MENILRKMTITELEALREEQEDKRRINLITEEIKRRRK